LALICYNLFSLSHGRPRSNVQFSYSTIPGVKGRIENVRKYTSTWDAWAREVVAKGHDRRTDKDGILASPCLWADDAPSREKAHAIDSGALVIDIDGDGEQTMHALTVLGQKLEARGLSFLLHSTHSHSKDTPSFRVWVPLSRRVLKSDWLKFWQHGTAYLGALDLRDNACKDVGRWYYMPSVSPFETPIMFYRPGDPLDVEQVWATPAPTLSAPLVATAPVDHVKLKEVIKKLKSKGDEEKTIDQIKKVMDGQAICSDEHGNRHAEFLSLTRKLAWYLTDVDPAEMGRIFAPTLSRYQDQTRFVPDYVAKMFHTAQEKAHAYRQEKRIEQAERHVLSIKQATGGKRSAPYRAEETAAWAHKMGVPPEAVDHLWILQKGAGYLTLVDGEYRGPYTREEAGAAIHRDLTPASDVGVCLFKTAKNGTQTRKTPTELVIDNGTVIGGLQYSYVSKHNTYDSEKKVLTIACAPVAGIKPEYHAGVARYLEILGGKNHSSLLQWLARVPDLELPLPILALIGVKNAAKSGLPHGLAKYWEHGRCTEIETAMSKFNAEMRHCPLVFADETLPVDGKGRPRTRDLRRFMQERARDIEMKFLPRMTLEGCTRTILSANSTSVVEGEDHLSADDVGAIADRFLFINVAGDVPAYIADIGHHVFAEWITSGAVARHMLHLHETVPMPVKPGRYTVPTDGAPELALTMATGTALGSASAEWIYRFLLDPQALYNLMNPSGKIECVHVQKGVLYVTATVMADHFDLYCRGMSRPTVRNISRGLDSVARAAPENVELPLSGKRTKLRPIDPQALRTWANNAQLDLDYEDLLAKAEATMAQIKSQKQGRVN
jgi:hypothetical protein